MNYDYQTGYDEGYEVSMNDDYQNGYDEGYDEGYDKGMSADRDEGYANMSVSYSSGLYTASLTDKPSVFETGTSMFEALGRLIFRVGNVSKVGVVP